MPIKDLLVHLDLGERTAARLDMAVAIAQRRQAKLTGLFGQRAAAHVVGVVANWPSEEYARAAAASKAAFERASAGLAHGWMSIAARTRRWSAGSRPWRVMPIWSCSANTMTASLAMYRPSWRKK